MSFLPISLFCYTTVLVVKEQQLRIFNQAVFAIFQRILCPFSITEEDRVCLFFFFFNYGDQTSPNFLKIHFKRVALELPTAICKREESGIHGRGPFPLGVSLPALDEGVDRLSTKAFLPWSDFAAY